MFKRPKYYIRFPFELRVVGRHFDYDFYRNLYEDVSNLSRARLLIHYCSHGWREGRDPTPDFSTSHYLEAYPDVKAADINPFVHYLSKGRREGRATIPSRMRDEILVANINPSL